MLNFIAVSYTLNYVAVAAIFILLIFYIVLSTNYYKKKLKEIELQKEQALAESNRNQNRNKILVTHLQNIKKVIQSPLGVQAEYYVYKSFIHKKEKGYLVESKKEGKKVLVSGQIGYILSEKEFISQDNLLNRLEVYTVKKD